MATLNGLIARVRQELGDQVEPFRQTYRGTGFQNEFDLPAAKIQTAVPMSLYKTYPATLEDIPLSLGTDFTLDDQNGMVTLTVPLEKDWMLTAQGYSYGLFSDSELQQYISDSILMHTGGGSGDQQTTRYRDSYGFIEYQTVATTIDNLPAVEEPMVAWLAAIQCLWALFTDSSIQIDVVTSEGTHIPRAQRFAQIQAAISALSERYQNMCAQLGVGLYAIQVSNLRRVSKTTGRLVPLFVEREYDDHTLPIRILPRIDRTDADPDGPPSQANYSYGGW